jgi:hypothetical protein
MASDVALGTHELDADIIVVPRRKKRDRLKNAERAGAA